MKFSQNYCENFIFVRVWIFRILWKIFEKFRKIFLKFRKFSKIFEILGLYAEPFWKFFEIF